MSMTTDWLESPELAGFGHTRPGDSGDAVGGVVPRLVIEPGAAAEAASALAWLSRERLFTVIAGSGTKLGWGRSPSGLDVLLTTRRLNRLIVHRHGDLTATFEAGATLASVNRDLAREGQWLPLDSAFEEATIGGLIATNDAGPLRHRYGTPRDLLIGMTIAVTDGRLVKSGGHVVKNVAGYDLGKLVSGSFGTLALIVDATFKLSPVLPASRTLVVDYDTTDALAGDLARLSGSQLEPLALDVQVAAGGAEASAPVRRLLVRFATSPGATASQTAAAQALLQGTVRLTDGSEEAAIWSEQVHRPWTGADTVIRLSWLPANLPRVLALLDDVRRTGAGVELTGRAALGAGFVRVGGDGRRAADLLRSHPDVVANVVVLQPGPAAGDVVDVWGDLGSAASVLRAVKATFDPAGILNAGRGPI